MYLTRRDGIYYLRKRVPVDLVAVYGKREILRSLSVKDTGVAVRLALRSVVALDDEFAQRHGLTPPSVERMQASQPAPSMPPRPLSQSPTLDYLIPIWRRENNPTDKTADAVARAVADVGNPAVATVTRATVAGMRDIWLERRTCFVLQEWPTPYGMPFLGTQSRALRGPTEAVSCPGNC